MVITRCERFNSQCITSFLWVYATIENNNNDQLVFLLSPPTVKSEMGKFDSQDIANIAYAGANIVVE
jgi:hypothetical protein